MVQPVGKVRTVFSGMKLNQVTEQIFLEYAGIIGKEAKTVDIVNPNLTLIGIKVIHEANRG